MQLEEIGQGGCALRSPGGDGASGKPPRLYPRRPRAIASGRGARPRAAPFSGPAFRGPGPPAAWRDDAPARRRRARLAGPPTPSGLTRAGRSRCWRSRRRRVPGRPHGDHLDRWGRPRAGLRPDGGRHPALPHRGRDGRPRPGARDGLGRLRAGPPARCRLGGRADAVGARTRCTAGCACSDLTWRRPIRCSPGWPCARSPGSPCCQRSVRQPGFEPPSLREPGEVAVGTHHDQAVSRQRAASKALETRLARRSRAPARVRPESPYGHGPARASGRRRRASPQ